LKDRLAGKALRLLARREHSRAELARKLAADASAEEIRSVLDRLEDSGLLSDRRFAEALVHARAARYGTARLRHELKARGIADALVDEALAGDTEAELARARQLWRRKFGVAPADRVEYARQARFLQRRGFATETIRKVLEEREE
jgi:regulatory protein